MSGSERRKAPQLSATKKPDSPRKDDRHTVRVNVSSQMLSDMKKASKRLFGDVNVPALIRLALQEKITTMFYTQPPQTETT